jgi:hypothetical protein
LTSSAPEPQAPRGRAAWLARLSGKTAALLRAMLTGLRGLLLGALLLAALGLGLVWVLALLLLLVPWLLLRGWKRSGRASAARRGRPAGRTPGPGAPPHGLGDVVDVPMREVHDR